MTKLTTKEFYNTVKNQAISTLIFYVNKFEEELTWDESDLFIPTYSKKDRIEQIAILLDILEVDHNIKL